MIKVMNVQINALESGLPIAVTEKDRPAHYQDKDKKEKERSIEGCIPQKAEAEAESAGEAKVILSLKNAMSLQGKLLEELTRQKAHMVGHGAKSMIAVRPWVRAIGVMSHVEIKGIVTEGQVSLFIQTDEDITDSLRMEVVQIGECLSNEVGVKVNAFISNADMTAEARCVTIFSRIKGAMERRLKGD